VNFILGEFAVIICLELKTNFIIKITNYIINNQKEKLIRIIIKEC
jgi:hypothetical protein